MVLQNKYRARASAKYQRGRGGGSGTSRGRGRGRGGSSGARRGTDAWAAVESEDGVELDENGEPLGEADSDAESESDDASADFPSLQASDPASSASRKPQELDEEAQEQRRLQQKYGRRKLESNAWKFQQEVKDPHAEESEPEPEVDISNLVERVKQLDTSRDAKAPPSLYVDPEEARRVEKDTDHSLAYLAEREQQRRRARGHGVDDVVGTAASGKRGVEAETLTPEERAAQDAEREQMQKDKEKAEAMRALKERFLGRGIGEREGAARTARLDGASRASAPGSGAAFKLPSKAASTSRLAPASSAAASTEERAKPRIESDQDFLDSMLR